eukprot:TRINITY_DN6958_c0_g1_i2.p1 TRINITY_DN6958_c0_g1~~TRINITY_DN6958_c0_g1_i2.p1  ORF type:complete len:300 (+),score=48.26 TRINITY_DN6958_c0_g1_i2:223-1122(+)
MRQLVWSIDEWMQERGEHVMEWESGERRCTVCERSFAAGPTGTCAGLPETQKQAKVRAAMRRLAEETGVENIRRIKERARRPMRDRAQVLADAIRKAAKLTGAEMFVGRQATPCRALKTLGIVQASGLVRRPTFACPDETEAVVRKMTKDLFMLPGERIGRGVQAREETAWGAQWEPDYATLAPGIDRALRRRQWEEPPPAAVEEETHEAAAALPAAQREPPAPAAAAAQRRREGTRGRRRDMQRRSAAEEETQAAAAGDEQPAAEPRPPLRRAQNTRRPPGSNPGPHRGRGAPEARRK